MTTPVPHDAPLGLQPPFHRLPDATRCGPVTLAVASLDRSTAWYARTLGFAVRERSDGVATMGAAHDDAVLLVLHEQPGAVPVPRGGRIGLFHVAWRMPTRTDFARLVRHVADLGMPAASSDHHVSEALYLADPDGLGVEVCCDRPRAQWRRSGRELVMVTEPLDVAALREHDDFTPWTGAPAGTDVGHVHLAVGDLDAVRAFHFAALGLDLMVWRYPGALFLAAGGYHHHLGANTWHARAPRADAGDARLLEWSLVLPDHAAVRAAADSVASYRYAVTRHADGSATCTDPFGIVVRLVPAPS